MNNIRHIVILCEAYRSIDYPLYILENKLIDAPVTIFITGLKDLYYLFQIINEKVFNNSLELIYYPQYKRRLTEARGIKKLLYYLPDILGERRHMKQFYNKYFAQLEDATVMFSTPGYTGIKIYVLRRLRKKNKLVYRDTGGLFHMGKRSPRSLREIATLLYYKIVYGIETQLGQFPSVNPWSTGFPLMPDSFMKNSVNNVIDWSNRSEIMADFPWEKYNIFDTSEHKVIYFHQDWVGRYVPDRDIFSRELNDIFNVLLRHYPEEEIARKYHPGHELNKDVIEIGEELPMYIPAQILYSDKVQIYLGISSSSIVNVRGGQAISIINLISLNDENIRERYKERLIRDSRTQILFPKSLEELEQILINLGKSRLKSNK